MNVRQQQFGFPDEDLKASLHDEIVLWLKDNALEVGKKLTGWTEGWDAKLIEGERTRFTQKVEQRKKILEEDLIRENLWRCSGDGELLYQVDKSARLNSMRDHLVTLRSWPGLSEPPLRQIDVSSACEVPIKRARYKTTDIVGYADIVLTIRSNNVLTTTSFHSDQSGNPMLAGDALDWFTPWSDPFKVGLDAKTTIHSFGQIVRDLNTYQEFCDWPFVVVSPEARFAQALADEGYGFIQYPDGVFLRPRWHRKNEMTP
jgi:hypothetical protein